MLEYINDRLVLNGKELEESQASVITAMEGVLEVFISDLSLYTKIMKLSFNPLAMKFHTILVNYPYYLHDHFQELSIGMIGFGLSRRDPFVKVQFKLDVANWMHPWTIREHITLFKDSLFIESINDYSWAVNNELEPSILSELELTVSIDLGRIDDLEYPERQRITLGDLFRPLIAEIERANADTIIQLSTRVNPNTVTIPFNFPDAVKVACQQYLLYFAQFLHDMGIDATAEITERSGQMLFSVREPEALIHPAFG